MGEGRQYVKDWMKPYLRYFSNTGGNDIEELLGRHIPPGSNDVVAAMQISMHCQLQFLTALRQAGMLRPLAPLSMSAKMKERA